MEVKYPTNRDKAHKKAILLAQEALSDIDLRSKLTSLGLSIPSGQEVHFKAFGKNVVLNLEDLSCREKDSESHLKHNEYILILHYLLPTGEINCENIPISFRELPGGEFYYAPFLSRGPNFLERIIGNDLLRLKENLNYLDTEKYFKGDVGAKIHCIGNLYCYLIYYCGDDEFPPEANLLFDRAIKKIYSTEDVAVLGTIICRILAK